MFDFPLNKRTGLLRHLLNFTPGIVTHVTGNLAAVEKNTKTKIKPPQILLIDLQGAGTNEEAKGPAASRLDPDYKTWSLGLSLRTRVDISISGLTAPNLQVSHHE